VEVISAKQLVMANDIFKWNRNVSALNDEQLKQEIDLVQQSSIKAFEVRRPEVDTHTYRNGTLTEHDFADTINLLLSILRYHLVEIGRDTSSQATHRQLRQFIGQDLAALELQVSHL
jgi:hypothetical protein